MSPTEWTVDSTPSVVIVDTNSKVRLGPQIQVRVFSRGEIALAREAGLPVREVEILLFDSTGRFLNTVSRYGEGPGEFRHPANFTDAGNDTIVCAIDERLIWFTSGGKLIRHLTMEHSRRAGYGADLRADGAFLAADYLFTPKPGRHTPTRSVFLVRDSGRSTIPYPPFALVEMSVVGNLACGNPFQVERRAVLGPDPLPVSLPGAGRWEVAQFGTDGKLRRILRANIPRPPVPDTMARSGKAIGFEVPDSLPAIATMQHDRAGHLWVGRHNLNPEVWSNGIRQPNVFDVFSDSTGQWLATVRLPAKIGQLLDISQNNVAVYWEDEDDIPFVRLHRIRRGEAAR